MYICTHCGWEGDRKRIKRGSKTVEILLWTVLLIPGPFYSIWRRVGGVSKQCPHCNLPTLAKPNTDAALIARRKFDVELGIIPRTPKKEEKKDELSSFGNERPAQPVNKKPVNPDEW